MTKDQLQQEKLKRSKSVSDIPLPPPEPNTNYPYTQLISQSEKITELEKETTAKSDTISLLRKKIESLEQNPPSQLLQDQLKEKQKKIEELRKQLEEINTELNNLKNPSSWPLVPAAKFEEVNEISELDESLIARHESLRDWFTEHSKRKKLETELAENIEEASSELIKQDDLITRLRDENRKLKFSNQSLSKDLDLAHRAVEWRKSPLPNYSDDYSYLKYALYSLLAVSFTLWLVKSFKNIKESPNYD